MFRLTIFVIINIILFSCSIDLKQFDPVLIVNNEEIFLPEIDSIAKDRLYNVRKETIDQLITSKLLNLEAEQRKTSVDTLIKSLFSNLYVSRPSYKISSDSISIINYQIALRRKHKLDSFIYVLKNKYPVYTFLQPVDYNFGKIKELSSYIVGNKNSENEVIILFDYNCPSCIKADSVIHNIYELYKDRIKFKYIYYSDYVDKTVIAGDAAAKQDKYLQMHDFLIANSEEMNDSLVLSFASTLGLNIREFEKDYSDVSYIKKHLKNRQILNEMGIYSVPCFIVNGKYIADLPSFKYIIFELTASIND